MTVTIAQNTISPVKMWATQFRAINPATGQLCIWSGPLVPGATRLQAMEFCQNHGLGYLEVMGVLVEREVVFEVGMN